MITEKEWAEERADMVRVLREHGIRDEKILAAMGKVRRHVFIPENCRSLRGAYGDHPWNIGYGQTVSQPFIVAYMIVRLCLEPGEKVLEIGVGSGYQAAVLAELGMEVYGVEIIPELAGHASRALAAEGYGGVRIRTGDGYEGWPEHSPYDAIIGACAPEDVPGTLVDQLGDGGRMILPIGVGWQRLEVVRRTHGRVERQGDLDVRFVPMVRGRT